MRYLLLLLFFIAGSADLYFIQMDLPYRHFSKPMIMLALIGYFIIHWSKLEEKTPKKMFLSALIAAWLGDVFLLGAQENMFLFGLLAFLVMQARYIMSFTRDGIHNKTAIGLAVILIPVAGYIMSIMWPHISSMKIPVIVYMFFIVATSIAAAARDKSLQGYSIVLLGTLFFLVSDTVLALHKFTPDIRLGSLTVMATYIAAQFLIVEGYIQGHLLTDGSK